MDRDPEPVDWLTQNYAEQYTEQIDLARLLLSSAEGNVKQQKSDYKKKEKQTCSKIDINEIHKFDLSSSSKAMSMDNVARKIFDVNTRIPQVVERSVNLGVINAAPIQPAERLVKSPERILSFDGLKNTLIGKAYASEMVLSRIYAEQNAEQNSTRSYR